MTSLASWRRRALQNAIDRERPLRSLLRWPAWLAACALRRPTVARFATGGLRMRLQPRLTGFGSTSLFIKRDAYEPELRLIRQFVRPGDVVLDIGASFGAFALFLAHYVGPAGRVHAFEPGGFSYTQLDANVALNGLQDRITLHRAAAGEAPNVLRLYHISDAPVTFSMGGEGDDYEEVPSVRVDATVPPDEWARVSFVKIDVEGFERFALEGARNILEAAHPTIMFEVSAAALVRSGMTPAAMYEYLAAYGYGFHRFVGNALEPVAGYPEGNIIAIAR